jgi:hypothetical protein
MTSDQSKLILNSVSVGNKYVVVIKQLRIYTDVYEGLLFISSNYDQFTLGFFLFLTKEISV